MYCSRTLPVMGSGWSLFMIWVDLVLIESNGRQKLAVQCQCIHYNLSYTIFFEIGSGHYFKTYSQVRKCISIGITQYVTTALLRRKNTALYIFLKGRCDPFSLECTKG